MPTENIGLDLVPLESCVYLFSYWLNETVAIFPSLFIVHFYLFAKMCIVSLLARSSLTIPYSVIEFSQCVWSHVCVPWTKYRQTLTNRNRCHLPTENPSVVTCAINHLNPKYQGNIRKHFHFTAVVVGPAYFVAQIFAVRKLFSSLYVAVLPN